MRLQILSEATFSATCATCLQKLDLTSRAERYRADPRLLFFVLAAGDMAGRALSEHASTSCLRRCVKVNDRRSLSQASSTWLISSYKRRTMDAW